MPNEDTPARRGWPRSGQSRRSVSSDTAPLSHSTFAVGSSTWSVRGSTPCRRAMTILITPAIPDAACVCPMFDLIEPSSSGWSGSRSWPYVASSACASIGSPSTVPVPCASTASTSDRDRPASASACQITRCWAGPFGAVSPLEAPSELMADPRTRASTWWPLRRASESRSTITSPTPSENPVPSAEAAKDLQRPSEANSPCCWLNPANMPGVAITVTPPASASAQSPRRSARAARCSATSDDEQAVSTVNVGPSSPKV